MNRIYATEIQVCNGKISFGSLFHGFQHEISGQMIFREVEKKCWRARNASNQYLARNSWILRKGNNALAFHFAGNKKKPLILDLKLLDFPVAHSHSFE